MRGAPQRGFARLILRMRSMTLSRQGRAALWMATLPAPIEAESSSMPGDHRFRFDDHQGRSPLTPESREPPTGTCRRQSDAPCVHGLSAEGPRADAEELGSRLGARLDSGVLAQSNTTARSL